MVMKGEGSKGNPPPNPSQWGQEVSPALAKPLGLSRPLLSGEEGSQITGPGPDQPSPIPLCLGRQRSSQQNWGCDLLNQLSSRAVLSKVASGLCLHVWYTSHQPRVAAERLKCGYYD